MKLQTRGECGISAIRPGVAGFAWHAGFPSRARPHAHSLLCVSAAAEQLRSLAGTLQKNSYNVYSRALPSEQGDWSPGNLAGAAELLLEDPAASADGGGGTEPDVIMNEITATNGLH